MSEEEYPKVHSHFVGSLESSVGTINYSGVERDWNVIGKTREENLALGRVYVVSSINLVAWGKSREEAVSRLSRTIELYGERKRSA